MTMTGKCPKCGAPLSQARLSPIDATDGTLHLPVFSVSCPQCETILGIANDPRRAELHIRRIMTAVGAS
jgi:uncharacterized Zn finger protein (UPF0148 family)